MAFPSPRPVTATLLCGVVVSLVTGCSGSGPDETDAPGAPSRQVVYRVDDTSTVTRVGSK